MTESNDNNPVEPGFYFFAYTFVNSGIVQSKLGDVETRDKINRELATLYDPDNVTLTTFRIATEEEVAEYRAALAQRYNLTPEDVQRMSEQKIEDEPTIN